MPRSTIDLFTDAAAAIARSRNDAGGESLRSTLRTREAGASGWYRLKIRSRGDDIQRLGIEIIDNSGQRICAFECVTPGRQFAGYIYLSETLASILVRVDFADTADASATLRPISIAEFIWQSARKGSLRRPGRLLRYYHRPTDPFVLRFDFPQPPRFGNHSEVYAWWIAEREPAAARHAVAGISAAETPAISILLTVCDPQPAYLHAAIESVMRQTSPKWQLCIADDASTNPQVRQVLNAAAHGDPRVTVAFRDQRGGISAATNAAFAQASSPFVTCLDHDDVLAPFAIEAHACALAKDPSLRLIYSDEDKIDPEGNRFQPYFKPDFSRELLYSYNYINHLTVHHTDTIRRIGGWRSEFDGAQDYDIILRTLEIIDEKQIGHVPLILYHWRAIAGSAAFDVGYKLYAIDAGVRALKEHLARRSIAADVEIVRNAMHRVRYELPQPQPKVSIIIPFRDRTWLLRACIESIREKTTFRNYELVLADNGSTERETLQLLAELKRQADVQVLHRPGPFNYSALNNHAVRRAQGDYICLLNNDIKVITPDWLDDMLGYASQPGVGCVGAKLYYANRTIQHAGIVLGIGGVAGHAFLNQNADADGYFGRSLVASNYSAVTAACLLVKRAIYLAAGGLDESHLAVAFNDVDFCLKVRALGYRNVLTPFAELFHLESATRGSENTAEKAARFETEARQMMARYSDALRRDPCYSPHLTLTKHDFSIGVD